MDSQNNIPTPDSNNLYDWSIHLIDPKLKDEKWCLNIIQRYKPLCLPFYQSFYAYGMRSFDTGLIHQYATGTQSPDIYKAIFDPQNRTASYMGVDFERIPHVIPKFRQIMADNIIKIPVEIVATATDPIANNKRGKDKERLKMQKALDDELAVLSKAVGYSKPIKSGIDKQILKTPMSNVGGGMDMSSLDMENDEELQLYMDAYYNMDVEVAFELAIQGIFEQNQIEETKKSWVYDAIDYGCAAGRNYCSDYTGLPKTEYLDVRNVLIPYTERRDAKNVDIWMYTYMFSLNECIEHIGAELTKEKMKEIYEWAVKTFNYKFRDGSYYNWDNRSAYNRMDFDDIKVPMTYFEFKSPNCEVYEESTTKYGKQRIKKKDFSYQAMDGKNRNEYWKFAVYGGYYLGGLEEIFKFGLINNMLTEKGKEQMTPYSLVFYLMDEQSMTERMIAHENNIIIAWLKAQQTLIDSKPPGYFFNWSVMSDIVVGDGGKITGLELAAMYRQTGSTFYNPLGESGDPLLANPNAPHMAAPNGLPNNFMQYWESIRQEMQMIRDEIGLNEFTDASTPNAKALVGVAKNSIYSSNSARQYLTDGVMNMIQDTARYTAVLISDIAQYNKSALKKIEAIVGRFNSDVVETLGKSYLNEIGIKLENELTETEKAEIRQLIIQEYAQGKLDLQDVLLIYFIRNYKLAARLLSLKSKKRAMQAAQAQQAQMEMQARTEQEIAQVKILLQKLDNEGKANQATITAGAAVQSATIKEHGDLLRKILTESSKHEADSKKHAHEKEISDKEHSDKLSEIALQNLADLNLAKAQPKAEVA